MNAKIAGEIVAENLSIKTYQRIDKYLTQCGEEPHTMQWLKENLQSYFHSLISHHCNGNFDKGESDFEETKKRIMPSLQTTMTDDEKETLLDNLWCIYVDGYFAGYTTGARDIETVLNDLDERTQT